MCASRFEAAPSCGRHCCPAPLHPVSLRRSFLQKPIIHSVQPPDSRLSNLFYQQRKSSTRKSRSAVNNCAAYHQLRTLDHDRCFPPQVLYLALNQRRECEQTRDCLLMGEQCLRHGTKLQMVKHIEITFSFFMLQIADEFPETVDTR